MYSLSCEIWIICYVLEMLCEINLTLYCLGNPYYDSVGSLGVGTLLGSVSAFLIYTNTEALLGRSIQPERLQRLTELLESDAVVR